MPRSKGLEWEHVNVIEQKSRGIALVRCKYCTHEWIGGPLPIRAHILCIAGHGVDKCPSAPQSAKDGCRKLHVGAMPAEGFIDIDAQVGDLGATVSASSPSNICGSSNASNTVNVSSIKRPRVSKPTQLQGKLAESWQIQARKNATVAVRRFFYAEDIPFCKVRSPYFIDMVKAIGEVGPTYMPPTYEALRVKELRDEVKCIDKDLLGVREKWSRYGCTIVCDGWSDAKKRPIINVLASSIYGSVFLKSVDTSGEYKSGAYIFGILKDAILDVGPENVVQVCMDNASNCVLAGELIEAEWPHIFYTRCTCHCLDLLFEDIGSLQWVAPVLDAGKKIVKFITRKPTLLAMFRKYSKKELLKPADTRFAYTFIVLANLLDERVYNGLRKMAVSDEWINAKPVKTVKGHEVTDTIYNANFWQNAKLIVKLMAPILKILRMADREGATMGLIYELTDHMVEKIENMDDVDDKVLQEIKELCVGRWDMMHSPLHAAGYVLHPIWRGKGQDSDEEVHNGWMTVIERCTHGNVKEQGDLIDDLDTYRSKNGTFSRPLALDESRMHEAVKWWESHGASTPKLQQLAIRILSQGSTASPCERNWSTFSLIHTKKRNRLKPSNTEKLVYIHTNLRLISKFKARGYEKLEVTLEMINKEKDDDRLISLQEVRESIEDDGIENMHAAGPSTEEQQETDDEDTSSSSNEEDEE